MDCLFISHLIVELDELGVHLHICILCHVVNHAAVLNTIKHNNSTENKKQLRKEPEDTWFSNVLTSIESREIKSLSNIELGLPSLSTLNLES